MAIGMHHSMNISVYYYRITKDLEVIDEYRSDDQNIGTIYGFSNQKFYDHSDGIYFQQNLEIFPLFDRYQLFEFKIDTAGRSVQKSDFYPGLEFAFYGDRSKLGVGVILNESDSSDGNYSFISLIDESDVLGEKQTVGSANRQNYFVNGSFYNGNYHLLLRMVKPENQRSSYMFMKVDEDGIVSK